MCVCACVCVCDGIAFDILLHVRIAGPAQLLQKMRQHYTEGEGIVCSQHEWEQSVSLFKEPYDSTEVEAMVQVCVCVSTRVFVYLCEALGPCLA